MEVASKWQIQEAKSKLSELIDTVLKKGPQFITRRGETVAVIVSADDFKKLTNPKRGIVQKIQSAPRVDLELRSN